MSTTLLQRLAMCRRLANLSVVTLLIGLMACETSGPSKLSLEDAKQVTLVFGTSTFVPPPRTLDDILKILDDQTLADLEDVAWILRMATREPRAGMEGWERANFFRQRGNANMELGKIRQALKDLREAERLSTELRSGLRSTIIEDLARLEIEIGNYRDAQRHLEEFLSLLPDSGKRGKRVGVYSQLARYHAWSGDIEGAEQFLSKAENALGGFMAFSRKARSKGPPKK